MKVLLINETCGRGSHGKICCRQAEEYLRQGHICRIAYGREDVPLEYKDIAIKIGGKLSIYTHVLLTRLFDAHGLGSYFATKSFIRWADTFDPDVVWLHNIHGYYLNYKLLFAWIKTRPQMKVKWTLHDEWALTGHCGCFGMVKCEKWKTHCKQCIQKKEYPKSIFFDACYTNFLRKKKAFTGVAQMQLITPSQWLADLTRESILKEYPVSVVYNTIDNSVFHPAESDFRDKNDLNDKKVLLCVANVWQDCKGLKDILLLQQMLDNHYAIVVVGVTEAQKESFSSFKGRNAYLNGSEIPKRTNPYREIVRKKSGVAIPANIQDLYTAITGLQYCSKPEKTARILFVSKTKNVQELASLYSMADVFVNPTREDNYPTVNLEAQACGTFVITYDTGGCKETLAE